MTPRNIKTKQEEKFAALDFFKKSKDNHEQMLAALKAGNFNAVGTLAIQCAISAADSICVFEKGLRSVSQDHFDVCDLVRSISIHDAEDKANILRRIISKKNLIQYERRNIFKSEADEIEKAASKFFHWVSDNISRSYH